MMNKLQVMECQGMLVTWGTGVIRGKLHNRTSDRCGELCAQVTITEKYVTPCGHSVMPGTLGWAPLSELTLVQ